MFTKLGFVLSQGFRNILTVIGSMNDGHLLLLFCILFLLLFLEILHIRSALKKQMKLAGGIAAPFFVCLILFFCVIASSTGTLIFAPSSQPEEAVEKYLSAWCAGNTQEAATCLVTPTQLWYGVPEGCDATDALYYEALSDSYSYQLDGPSMQDGKHALQNVKVTALSLSGIPGKVALDIPGRLDEIVESRRSADVVDAEDHYLPEVLDEVYGGAVRKTLEDVSDFYTVTPVTLELEYQGGEWKILPNNDLTLAFTGGIAQIENYANNAKSEALGDLSYVPKIYTLAEDVTIAPTPIDSAYGDTDVAGALELISQYERLIDGKELFFDPDVDFTDDQIHYYADDTILVLTWRELFLNHSVCFSEVFVADGSQFRRKLAADTYGSGIQKPATQLAAEANAVVAMNGDFYKFRTQGVTVYQRELYRFNPSSLDCCHVNSAGDLIFTYAGELTSEEQARQFIEDNDITFTLAFGPVLVADGEMRAVSSYLIGEVTDTYSRSAIGQSGHGHYLLMTSNYGFNTIGATIGESAQIMYDKGCENAYALDGGQTAEIVWRGEPYNHVDYGNERAVSDILYFATALPEEER